VRVQIILNPQANHGRAIALRDQLLSWGKQYGGLDVVLSTAPGHARQLAEEAVLAGYELVAAAGGDGTVHEVVNGLVHGGRSQATLGVIPIGSGNDFAYGLALLTDPRSALDRLFNGRPRTIDLARIEDDKGRYELVNNAIGIGFDAMVTIQSLSITWVHGFAMYTLAALRTILLHYDMPHLVLRYDDQEVEQDVLLLAAGIGPRAGGGFYLTPHAVYDDNLLDSCTVSPVSRLTMLWMLPKVMRGTHITSRHVTMRRSSYIEVLSDRPLPIHVDGEIFAYPHDAVRRVTINSLPQALRVMVDAPPG
jgi:diacylglycerol kinase (ATP)